MTLTTRPLSDPYGTLSYRETGTARDNTAPVVLIHGVGMQSAAWTPQFEYLANSHRVIALDMPGHGASDPISDDATLPDYVTWLAVALDAVSLDRANLIGHSMGALIAAGAAVDHGDRVERVALLNGVYRRNARARAAVIARAEEIRSGHFDIETPLQRWFDDTDTKVRADVADWLGNVNPAGYATAYAAFAKGDDTYADGFAQISCPLLALTGSDDPNSSPEMSIAMAAAAPKGRAVIIDGHRHMVNLTAPDAVNTALSEWLQEPLQTEDAA